MCQFAARRGGNPEGPVRGGSCPLVTGKRTFRRGTCQHSRRVSLRLTDQLVYLLWVFNGIKPGARELIHAKQ